MMTRWRCTLVPRLLTTAFEQRGLARWLQPFAWREVSRCERCRAVYDKLVYAERMLASGGKDADTPTALEFELFAARVLGARRVEARAPSRVVYAFASAAVFASVLFAVVRVQEPRTGARFDEFTARGDADIAATRVRVLCQETDATGVVRTRSLAAPESPSCPVGATLAFAYVAARDVYVSLHWQSGQRSGWLVRNAQIARTVRPAPLDTELRLKGVGSDVTLSTVTSGAPLPEGVLNAIMQAPDALPDDVAVGRQNIEVAQ